jgi:hypothetical protein
VLAAGIFLAAVAGFPGFSAAAQSQKGKLGFVSENYEFSSVDGNGVDIQSGSVRIAADLLSIGSRDRPLSYSVITPSLAQAGASDPIQLISYGLPLTAGGSLPFKFDNYSGGIGLSGINNCENWFELGGSRSDFCGTLAQGLVAADGSNASIVQSGSELVYTDRQGVKYN